MNKNLIFDLDGTLVASAPDIHDAANRLLADHGYAPLAMETVISFIGNGVPRLVQHVMNAVAVDYTEAKHAEWIAVFSAHYARNPATLSYLNKGVASALEQFRGEGCKMAICTNKPYEMTLKVLGCLKIEHYFQAVIGGDSLAVRKPDRALLDKTMQMLDVSACVYIGDSEVDAQTARNADQPFYLFTDGYRNCSADDLNPVAQFDDFTQLSDLLRTQAPKGCYPIPKHA